MVIRICILASLMSAGAIVQGQESVDTSSGSSDDDIAALAVNKYREESDVFFASTPSQASTNEFFTSWRDRLVGAYKVSEDLKSRIAALGDAIAISNVLKDYVVSVELTQKLLDLKPDRETSIFWLTQLGEVARLEWERSGSQKYGNIAVASFRGVLEHQNTKNKDVRLLVSGWLADLAGSAMMAREDISATAAHVDAAVRLYKEGHQPGGRLLGTGFDQKWFIEYSLRLHLFNEDFKNAFDAIRTHSSVSGMPLSTAGVIVDMENSNRAIALSADKQLDAYTAFLDKSADFLSEDSYSVELRLVAARRYFRRNNFSKAAHRLEQLLGIYKAEIDASSNRAYYLSEIWTMLRIIYNNEGLTDKAKEAAKQAIEVKMEVNQPTTTDEDYLTQQEAEDTYVRNIRNKPQDASGGVRYWLVAINIGVILILITVLITRRLSVPKG